MKRIISLLTLISIIFTFTITANAKSEMSGAQKYAFGSSESGYLEESGDNDTYKFELKQSAKININLFSDIAWLYIRYYDENGKEIHYAHVGYTAENHLVYQEELFLCEGTYYLNIENYTSGDSGEYEFTIKETAVYESFPEEQDGSNNSIKTSNKISELTEYTGCIALNDETDIYQLELSSSGIISASIFSDMDAFDFAIYNSIGEEVIDEWVTASDYPTGEISFIEDFYLCRGKYYISINGNYNTGEYSLKYSFTASNETFAEEQGGSNNKMKNASVIEMNKNYNGFLAENDEVDIFRINVTDSEITLNFNGNISWISFDLLDANGQEVWSDSESWNYNTEEIFYTEKIALSNGLYYFHVSSGEVGAFTFNFSNGAPVVNPTVSNSEVSVIVNGQKVYFDQAPIIENGRTLVPLRAIFEALGASVDWNDASQTVSAKKGSTSITLQIGSVNMYVNGSVKVLDVPAKLINSRTLVPVRAISEAFGCTVGWYEPTQTVTING